MEIFAVLIILIIVLLFWAKKTYGEHMYQDVKDYRRRFYLYYGSGYEYLADDLMEKLGDDENFIVRLLHRDFAKDQISNLLRETGNLAMPTLVVMDKDRKWQKIVGEWEIANFVHNVRTMSWMEERKLKGYV